MRSWQTPNGSTTRSPSGPLTNGTHTTVAPLTDVFVGAGGLAWGLERLRRSGHAETALDLAAVAQRALARYREAPFVLEGEELPSPARSSLFNGESGLVLVAWLLEPTDELASELLELVRQNIGNEANELMWGVPGTLLAARLLHARTREERWRAAVEESAQALRDERDDEGLWTQKLYGHSVRILGPIHGFVGNIAALGDTRGAADVLSRTAIVEDGRANWPPSIGREDKPRLQWCHGAPGIIATASELPRRGAAARRRRADLGRRAAACEEKGAGLCHGTAGNGYALLKTFERTGDERWLERARAFAMHALAQVEQLPARYSLFTGGIGAALYAADCIDARRALSDRRRPGRFVSRKRAALVIGTLLSHRRLPRPSSSTSTSQGRDHLGSTTEFIPTETAPPPVATPKIVWPDVRLRPRAHPRRARRSAAPALPQALDRRRGTLLEFPPAIGYGRLYPRRRRRVTCSRFDEDGSARVDVQVPPLPGRPRRPSTT